jgi:hypothetical protein
MKKIKPILILCMILLTGLPVSAHTYSIIPYPKSLIPQEGEYIFKNEQKISFPTEISEVAKEFICRIKTVTGINLVTISESKKADISFTLQKNMANEAYKLYITPSHITIQASTPAGFFYAIQSLYQLMPPQISVNKRTECVNVWNVPCVQIDDEPRFAYRGMMLDVARYFMPKEYVLEFIDRLAAQKINTFHFHLTEDQGWRIEIKKYPKLTSVGATRPYTMVGYKTFHAPIIPDNTVHQGYYTQDDIREIVAYAQKRFVTIIPEIELPGHSSAAVAAYPELSCGIKDRYEVIKTFGIFDNVFCPNEKTFRFLEDVFSEVAALFPGTYIHIGGDECPKTAWKQCSHCQGLMKKLNLKDENQLQSYFIHEVEKIVNRQGKQIIGWDEILDGGLAPNATVMSWRGEKGGIEAAKSGHSVIMMPNADTYLNYYQEDPEYAPIGSGSFLPIEQVYSYEPIPAQMNDRDKKYVLGMEAALWTPYMKNPDVVDYYMYPRFYAVAEVAWTPAEAKNYTDFLARIRKQYARLDLQQVKACRNYFDAYIDGAFNKRTRKFEVRITGMIPGSEIRYTTDGRIPTSASNVYSTPIVLHKNTTIKAAVFTPDGNITGKITEKNFVVNKATGKSYICNVPYRFKPDNPGAKDYSKFNFCGLTNGIKGYLNHVHPWVAIRPTTITEITIDLEKQEQFSSVRYSVLNGYGQEAVAPQETWIEISDDNNNFKEIAHRNFTYHIENKWQIFEHNFTFAPQKARYVKIKLKNGYLPHKLGGFPIPEEKEGSLGMIFIDEVEIN